jgi:hypothetical protein
MESFSKCSFPIMVGVDGTEKCSRSNGVLNFITHKTDFRSLVLRAVESGCVCGVVLWGNTEPAWLLAQYPGIKLHSQRL